MVEQEGDFVLAVVGADGDGAAAQCIQGEMMEHELRPLVEQDGHAVSGPIACCGVVGLAFFDFVPGLLPSELFSFGVIGPSRHGRDDVCGRGAVFRDRPLQRLVERAEFERIHFCVPPQVP
jgi:hypothetical protein